MGRALRTLVNWLFKAMGFFVIAASWLAFFGLWEKIGSLSLDFVNNDMTMTIALTVGGVALIAFSSSVVKLFE